VREAGSVTVDVLVARLLTLGTRLAVAALTVGTLLFLLGGGSPLAMDWARPDPADLPAGLAALRPEAFLWLGLVLTVATPLLRVGSSTLAFARSGERVQVALGLGVLAVVALAVLAGWLGG